MPEQRILVTGASGGLGRAVVSDLLDAGYAVVGADRVEPEQVPDGLETCRWDGRDVAVLADAARGCSGLVHLAAIPHPGGHPDEVVFTNNTAATFAALQAAALTRITRVAIASSGSAYGSAWSPEPTHVRYVPVDEGHPLLNFDPYGLSKEVDERTAEMFCRRTGMSVAALRFHWIATREEQLERVRVLREDDNWPEQLRELWGYVDRRDAARACRLALETAEERPYGFVPLNIVAADALTERAVPDLLAEHAPDIEVRGPLAPGGGAFAIDRAAELIGWVPQHSWRD